MSGVVCLVTTKPLFEKILKVVPTQKTNADALIGKTASVIEDIDNLNENGAVKVEGKVCSAEVLESESVLPYTYFTKRELEATYENGMLKAVLPPHSVAKICVVVL